MAKYFSRYLILIPVLSLLASCANIVPPSGGLKDTKGPVLRSINPSDSLLNTRIKRIEMKFDEFITVSDVNKELHISPALSISPTMTGIGKTVVIKIADTLLQDQTTYTISFGAAIKDLHEGNPYLGKNFLFSTGSWFDSLQLHGHIMDAQSGKTDSSGTVRVLLYPASLPFDIVTRQKPAYVSTADKAGNFHFNGLPAKTFRIFALKETADNLQFDNNEEYIAFLDTTIQASTDTGNLLLTLFREKPDTAVAANSNSTSNTGGSGFGKKTNAAIAQQQLDPKTFIYLLQIDTSDIRKRTVEINSPLHLSFSRKLHDFKEARISLHSDSSGVEKEETFHLAFTDTGREHVNFYTSWKQNTVYTLRLLKSFATDTAGTDALPSKYIFRTKQEEDYGKMEIHIPGKYQDKRYLLRVSKDADSIYLKAITDTVVSLRYLSPGNYTISIIDDSNGDGLWTSGDLNKRRHPEKVYPHAESILMKPGWEHIIDF